MTGNHPEDAVAAAAASNRRDDDAGVMDADRGFVNTDRGVDDRDPVDRDALDRDRDIDREAGEVPVGADADAEAQERPDPSEGAVVDGVASDPLLNVVDGRPETLGMDSEGAAPADHDRGFRDEVVQDDLTRGPDHRGGATATDEVRNQEQDRRI